MEEEKKKPPGVSDSNPSGHSCMQGEIQLSPLWNGRSRWECSAPRSHPGDFFQHKIKEKVNSNFLLGCSAQQLTARLLLWSVF